MARSNGTAAASAILTCLLGFSGLASCAALESWDQFSGGSASGPADSGRVDSSLADAGTEPSEAGGDSGTDAAAGIAFVQVNAFAHDPNMVAKLDVPYTEQPQSAGDLNVVIVGWYDDAVVSTVTDTSGNKYTLAVSPTVIPGTNAVAQSIWYAPGIPAAAKGANVVSVTWDKVTDSPDVRVLEYSGLSKTAPLDAVATLSGTGLTASTGNATTMQAPALLVVGGTSQSGFSKAGQYMTRIVTEGQSIAADRIVTATGAYSAEGTLVTSSTWVLQLVAFH